MAGRALQQAHHPNRAAGGHEQLPLPRTVAQLPAEPRPPGLQLLRAEQLRLPRAKRQAHLPSGRRLPLVVEAFDRRVSLKLRHSMRHDAHATLQGVSLGRAETVRDPNDARGIGDQIVLAAEHRMRQQRPTHRAPHHK